MVVENRPVDPGSIQGRHRPISFIRTKHRTRANDFFVKPSINNHIVGLVHRNHIMRTRLMYHAVCKVEFQPFKRLYSQLTFFNFYKIVLTIFDRFWQQRIPFLTVWSAIILLYAILYYYSIILLHTIMYYYYYRSVPQYNDSFY